MALKITLTDELCNTQYAPLAALLVHYQQNQALKPLETVAMRMKSRNFTPHDKLIQVFISILAGCRTLSEVNTRLRHEHQLARVTQWPRFADQSTLSRTLDQLTQMNIDQLQQAVRQIWRHMGLAPAHDWRSYLWLDYDLSGLPCSSRAQKSQKGYFSDKKTPLDGN